MSQASAEAPNAEQIEFWNEVQGDKWVRLQDRTDAMLQPIGNAAIERLNPQPGERLLDVGCGCGTTSMELANRVSPGGEAPTAKRAVGASLTKFTIKGDASQSAAMIIVKLLVLPTLVWVMCTEVFGVSALWTAVATLAAAMPTGVNAFLLASANNTYLARSATAVLVSTAFSLLTVGGLLALIGPAR